MGVSTSFGAHLVLARWYTTVALGMARQFGVLLDAGADAYALTEAASAAMLGGAATAGTETIAVPAAVRQATAVLEPAAPPAAPGQAPAAPRDIARLIDDGRTGTGPRTWRDVAESLRGEARRLEEAAEHLRGAVTALRQGWESAAADMAAQRMTALGAWFEEHAAYVGALASAATAHVEHFRTATTEIPPFAAVVDAERELRAANDANARSGGKLQPAVVRAQVKLSKLYTQSTTGFGNYTFAAAGASTPHPPAPPPGLAPAPADPVPRPGPGDGPVMSPMTDPAHTAPVEPTDAGGGVGEELHTPGPAWPPADVAPGALDPSQDPVLTDTAASVMPQVIPAVIGGVVGGAGGALGGLAGAGSRAMQALSPASMMSGLGEPSGGAPPQQGGGEPAAQPSAPSGGSDEATGSAGGSEPGDTEPAGGQGPLSAPTGLASAPTVAAPMSAPMPGAALSESATAAGAPTGAMMPPMMGGPRGGGSGVENSQLYKQRELQVTVPPNSEPVKGRREGRRSKDGAK